jgi:CRP-like cAMP-binding protein
MDEEKLEILQTISEEYTKLSDASTDELLKCANVLYCNESKVLIKEGQYSDKTYFLYKGSARAYYLKNGKEITDWFAFENNFISAVNSFFTGAPSQYVIEVMEPSTLLEISKSDVDRMSLQYPEVGMLGYQIVVKTMLQLQQRVLSLQFETAQQKYDNLLKIHPEITQRVPLTHIASYIGIAQETLSRIRNPKNRI